MILRVLLMSLMILANILPIFAQDDTRAARRRAREQRIAARDTLKARYPIAPTTPENIDDIKSNAYDLRSPQNIVTYRRRKYLRCLNTP